jgi:hypothetical protein
MIAENIETSEEFTKTLNQINSFVQEEFIKQDEKDESIEVNEKIRKQLEKIDTNYLQND